MHVWAYNINVHNTGTSALTWDEHTICQVTSNYSSSKSDEIFLHILLNLNLFSVPAWLLSMTFTFLHTVGWCIFQRRWNKNCEQATCAAVQEWFMWFRYHWKAKLYSSMLFCQWSNIIALLPNKWLSYNYYQSARCSTQHTILYLIHLARDQHCYLQMFISILLSLFLFLCSYKCLLVTRGNCICVRARNWFQIWIHQWWKRKHSMATWAFLGLATYNCFSTAPDSS